jgi:hypothetical protein
MGEHHELFDKEGEPYLSPIVSGMIP